MKRVLLVLACVFMFSGCSPLEVDENYKPAEQPHLYWKDVQVVVLNIDTDQWWNGKTTLRQATITVRSDEYGIEATIKEDGGGMFNNISFWDAKIGDIRQAKMYSYVMDSTGEVISREIKQVY